MDDQNPTGKEPDDRGPSERHAMAQGAVMAFVLDEFPARCTIAEISLALNLGKTDFRGDDEVRNAIRDLTAAGLLHDEDGFISPTRAALYCSRLEMPGGVLTAD